MTPVSFRCDLDTRALRFDIPRIALWHWEL
jgi:hypothetical protein